MRRALALAARGWARTRPNPMVGAVVVCDGAVVGEGWHAEYGGPHAEVVALDAAAERARGATLYVSLEPCNHHGRTPPCTEAIVRAGIARIVYAVADPNPVARGGVERLRAAGIEVTSGVEVDAARALNAEFFHRHEQQTTFVALKLALSLDGRLSARTDAPSDVTGPAARAEVQRLRAGHDAILVGAGTARADDPLLTVRGELRPRTPPLRVVVDTHATLAPDSRLVRTTDEAPVVVFCTEAAPAANVHALQRAGVRVERVAATARGVDLSSVLERLCADGVRAVLCEGGGAITAGLLALDRIERMHLFVAPRFFGPAGTAAFPLSDVPSSTWRLVQHTALDDDVHLIYDRVRDQGCSQVL